MDFPILTVTTFTPLVGALIIAVAPARYARVLGARDALSSRGSCRCS